MAMLDGVAQLWEHSPQWFCLVCQHLLQIGVLSPTSAVHYFFREDNNNAIALSPFLWEVRRIKSFWAKPNLVQGTQSHFIRVENTYVVRGAGVAYLGRS